MYFTWLRSQLSVADMSLSCVRRMTGPYFTVYDDYSYIIITVIIIVIIRSAECSTLTSHVDLSEPRYPENAFCPQGHCIGLQMGENADTA